MVSCVSKLISQPKLGQIGHVGGVLKTSGPADFKSAPGFENWPRFVGVIEQNKIFNSLCQYCINTSMCSNVSPFHTYHAECWSIKWVIRIQPKLSRITAIVAVAETGGWVSI